MRWSCCQFLADRVSRVFRYGGIVLFRLALVSTLALIAIGCTDASEPTTTTADTATTATEPTTTTAVVDAPAIESGRLAIIEDDGTISVTAPDGSNRLALTEPAGESIYTQPVWSPDSTRVAFGELSEDGFAVRVEEVGGEGGVTLPVSNNPFFMYWSPDSERIGVLHNGAQGLDFEMADVGEGTIEVLDSGSPFYFSWSPEGDRVVIHEGANRFEILDRSGQSTPLGETAAGYLVPQWFPQGILHVADDHLVLQSEGELSALAEVGEQTMFVANPGGSLIALQSLAPRSQTVSMAQSERVEDNAVVVVDTRSLEIEVVDTHPVVGMWWSPDGRHLLLLTPVADGSSVEAKVWSRDQGLVDYTTYQPSPLQVRDVFPFFPQYAQSMTFWSPDSSGFAMAGEVDGEAGIWVQALGAGEPSRVAGGIWVAWSGE